MTNDLNSYDIASVEVLKGSAASALYGSRGQNGVIMITTKSGKKGKKSFTVEINTGITFEKVGILPELQTKYGGGYGLNTETVDGVDYLVPDYNVDESWGPKYDKNIEVIHWWGAADYWNAVDKAGGVTAGIVPETAPWVAPSADVEDFYETGIAYQNSINIVSTGENTALRLGYTNVSMTGIVPNSSQMKHNFNINGSASLWDDFVDVTANLNFVNTQTEGRPQAGYGDNSQSQKFFQWGQRQLDFDKLADYINPDGTMRTWNRHSFTDGSPVYSDNPYWTAYKNYQDDDRTRVFGKTGVTLNLTDYITASGTLYLDTYTFNARERVSKGSQALSMFKQVNRQATETNLEGKLAFNKTINDFSVLAMLGANQRVNNYARFEAETDGGLVVDGLYTINNSANQALTDAFKSRVQVNSWFLSTSIGYKNMAYIDASYRKDYDSTLPEDNNVYGYFAASGSFIISQLLSFDWLDNLKLRVNYGETGNGTDAYQVYNVWGIGDPFNGSPTFTNSTSLKNLELESELTSEIEFGLEGVFFKNRLGFDFSYYNRNTENQIVPIEVSGSSGYTSRYINAGKINNTGIELMLFGTPVQTKDFSWDISVNFAKNKNEVLDLPEGLDKIQLARAPFGGAYINAVEGATFQELYAYDYIYDDDGNKVIDQSTGFYATDGELKSVGSVLPDWTGGIRNSFKYKNFDFSALIDISQGGVYYSLSNMWGMYSGMLDGTTTSTSNGNTIREDGLVLDGVIGDIGTDADGNTVVTNTSPNTINIDGYDYATSFYHGFGTPSATSVFDADYIKLREVTIGYTLPKLFDMVQSIRISLYGRNLAIWGLDNKGIDPETIVAGSGNVQGIEGGLVPGTKSYGFNLKINF
jgi:TonB-linked SusC/RagA family outer membrane protein